MRFVVGYSGVAVATAIGALASLGTFMVQYFEFRRRYYPHKAVASSSFGSTKQTVGYPADILINEKHRRLERLTVLGVLAGILAVVSLLLFFAGPTSANPGSPNNVLTSTAPTSIEPTEPPVTSSETPPTTTEPPYTASSETTAAPIPIRITYPPKTSPPYGVLHIITVKGVGDVPSDRHLWIFVYGSGSTIYYPQDN